MVYKCFLFKESRPVVTVTITSMDAQTINEHHYHDGGKHGPGQEVYYAMHRIRLWRWYCNTTNTHFHYKDTSLIFKKKKEILQGVCQSLDLPTNGSNKELVARLDMYEFTPDQLLVL
jgi:hypothetical protein